MNTEKISMIIMRCAKKVNGIQFGYFKNSDERSWKVAVSKSFSSEGGEERVAMVRGLAELAYSINVNSQNLE